MAREKKKTARTYTPNLNPERYGKYLTALIEGEEAAKNGQVFWNVKIADSFFPEKHTKRHFFDHDFITSGRTLRSTRRNGIHRTSDLE